MNNEWRFSSFFAALDGVGFSLFACSRARTQYTLAQGKLIAQFADCFFSFAS
jgi:hypothetical protein